MTPDDGFRRGAAFIPDIVHRQNKHAIIAYCIFITASSLLSWSNDLAVRFDYLSFLPMIENIRQAYEDGYFTQRGANTIAAAVVTAYFAGSVHVLIRLFNEIRNQQKTRPTIRSIFAGAVMVVAFSLTLHFMDFDPKTILGTNPRHGVVKNTVILVLYIGAGFFFIAELVGQTFRILVGQKNKAPDLRY